jgi:hypothetical protein
VPDILFCYKGLFVAFETKRPTEDLEPIQKAQFKVINAAGGFTFRIRSREEAVEAIKTIILERHGV